MNPLRYVNSWPTVVFACVAIAGVVGIFALAKPDERITILTIFSTLATVGAAVARQAFAVPPPKAPTRLKDKDDDDGDAGNEALVEEPPTKPLTRVPVRITGHPRSLVRSIMRHGFAFAMLLLSACSPSALQTHATIALVASHTLEVTRASALATCTALRDTCAADAACIEHTRADCLAVADAQDATVAAVAIYVDAVELAALADEGRVMEALRFALEAAARAWVSLGERLAVVGISLPALGGVQ